MKLVSSPALRPSHPHGCRKRTCRQGHALSGRCAGLDVHALASGLIHSRATDEEASGGGSVKGNSQFRETTATRQKSGSHLPRFFRIPTHGEDNTCKPAPVYASQSSPHTYIIAAHSAFNCSLCHAHHADHSVSRILIERLLHDDPASATYRFPMSRILARYCRHTSQPHAGYNSAPPPIRTRHIPDVRIMRPRFRTDACSFVRPCLRGPAYVSSIRSAYSLTAGEGRRPFEPRKPKGGKTVKRVKPVRKAAVILRVYPEERDIPRFNAALHGRPTTSTHYAKKHDRRHKRQDTPPALFLRCGLRQGRFLISYKSL